MNELWSIVRPALAAAREDIERCAKAQSYEEESALLDKMARDIARRIEQKGSDDE